MNKVAIVVMILGALITVGGIALIFTGDSFEENIEEGITRLNTWLSSI